MSVRRSRAWTALTLGFALLLALALGWCIAEMPMTVYDGVGPILDAERIPSTWSMFVSGLSQRGFLRPLRVAQIKLVYDLAGGHEFLAYKAVHVALTLGTCLLFASLLAVGTGVEFVAATVALMIAVGHHSFFMLVGEAYPINHFLEMVMLALVVAHIARRPAPRWWSDGLVLVVLAIGMLTLESGVLLWVVLAACYGVGWRGVSRPALVGATMLLAGYFVVRFGLLHVAGPGLDERASGWWLGRLEPLELTARFGHNPLPFYAYNVMSAVMTLLFAEPRAGTWILTRQWLAGDVPPWMAIHVASSTLVTLLVIVFAAGAVRRLGRGAGDDHDRLAVVGLVMVAANAAISFGYLKDEVLSIGSTFYAAAAFAALSAGGRWVTAGRPRAIAALLVVPVLLATSALWTLRAVGTFYGLRSYAYKVSYDWAVFPLATELPADAANPATRALFTRLRAQNLRVRVPNPTQTDEYDAQRLIEIR